MIKNIYKNSTANIIPKGKKLEVFHIRSRTRHIGSFSSLLFNNVLEGLALPEKYEQESAVLLFPLLLVY